MDIGSCFTLQQEFEFARFELAADKTSAQRLSYMSAVPPIACDEAKHGATKIHKVYMKALFSRKKILQKGVKHYQNLLQKSA